MKTQLKSGWRMTEAQHQSYWWNLQTAHRVYCRTTPITFEAFRALVHTRAFGRNLSAKDIDRLGMFGEFKKVCAAIKHPDDLNAQMAIAKANDPRTVLIHRILEFPASYILCLITSPRFAHCSSSSLEDLEDKSRWNEKDLTDLRNTLCARNPDKTVVVETTTARLAANKNHVPTNEGKPFQRRTG